MPRRELSRVGEGGWAWHLRAFTSHPVSGRRKREGRSCSKHANLLVLEKHPPARTVSYEQHTRLHHAKTQLPPKNPTSPTLTATAHPSPSPPQKMADETTTRTPAPTHEPPSLPNSPLPKRTKVIDPTPFVAQPSDALPRGSDSGAATPTPLASTAMASLNPPAHTAPSIAAAAAAEQQLQVLLLSDRATAPTKGSACAAGHDLYSAKDTTIPARGRALVPTDISISVPVGTCMCSSFSVCVCV